MQKIASMLGRFKNPYDAMSEEERSERERAIREEEEQVRRSEYLRRLGDARIPERYKAAELADCLGEVQRYAEDVIDGGDGWMLLVGANGRGKTHQACATLRHVVRKIRGRFCTMQGILDECKDTFGRPESMESVKRRYISEPFLVIDDFGKEQATEWSLPLVFAIIDGRYNRCKPTMFTTNMDANGLLAHLMRSGERTMADSVLSRVLTAECVAVAGVDRRRRHG